VVQGRVYENDTNVAACFPGVFFRGASEYSRATHIRERLRLWYGTEPDIPHEEIRALRAAYAHSGIQGHLTKTHIATIIDLAGLSKRKLLEKWITIRVYLSGVDRRRVGPQLSDRVEQDMVMLSEVWDRNKAYLVSLVKRKRDNIPNLNYLFHQVLLRQGQDYFDYYRADFPQVGVSKAAELSVYYFAMCQFLGWSARASYRLLPLPVQ